YQKIDQPLPDVQNKMLRIYDSKDYALNMFDVPVIAYCGEIDPAVEQTLIMQDAARALKAPLAVLIGHKMGHKFDDMNLKTFMAFHAAHSEKGRPEFPGRRELKFVTYTLKFNKCDWFRIEEQEEPYERTEVVSTFADGMLSVTTENVRAIAIARGAADAIVLDGGAKVARASAAGGDLPDVYFRLEADGWKVLSYQDSLAFADNVKHHKRHGLQGPIDDAFTQPFVLVEGSRDPWNENVEDWSSAELKRVAAEWDEWFRGQPRVVLDTQLSDKDIASKNLILFGDPGCNAVIARIADKLPIQWTKDSITVAGKKFASDSHVPVLICPNPLNPSRYVVLNSGPTVKAEEYKKSNAWFFPRLGDAAVLKLDGAASSPVWSTIMNSDWEIEE
ncbi:MAG TPA: hypothetical protein VM510_02915, partial [Caulifigura sp.]|nr:hypothetical protein [Caulifigura sp.]